MNSYHVMFNSNQLRTETPPPLVFVPEATNVCRAIMYYHHHHHYNIVLSYRTGKRYLCLSRYAVSYFTGENYASYRSQSFKT